MLLMARNCCADGCKLSAQFEAGAVGGTSAGLAVLSQFIYTGALGSVTSSQALANPFHRYVTLDRDLFQSSLGVTKLYDSHFVTRDRMGRSLVFLSAYC